MFSDMHTVRDWEIVSFGIESALAHADSVATQLTQTKVQCTTTAYDEAKLAWRRTGVRSSRETDECISRLSPTAR